jgi:hypothetical protein
VLGVKEEEARIAIAAAVERAGAEWKGAMEGLTLQLKAAEQKCQVDNCRICNSVCVCVCQRNSLSLSLSLSLFLTLTLSLSLSLSLSFSQDEELFRRQAEIDLNSEKRRMQRTLEGALAQVRSWTRPLSRS